MTKPPRLPIRVSDLNHASRRIGKCACGMRKAMRRTGAKPAHGPRVCCHRKIGRHSISVIGTPPPCIRRKIFSCRQLVSIGKNSRLQNGSPAPPFTLRRWAFMNCTLMGSGSETPILHRVGPITTSAPITGPMTSRARCGQDRTPWEHGWPTAGTRDTSVSGCSQGSALKRSAAIPTAKLQRSWPNWSWNTATERAASSSRINPGKSQAMGRFRKPTS